MPLWDMLSAAREVRTMLQGVSLAQFQAALIVMRATERRQGTIDNHCGFMLIEPHRNIVLAGERFDWSAEDVIGFCHDRAVAAS